MWVWVKKRLDDITSGLILAVILAAIGAGWALVKPFVPHGWSWPSAVLVFLVIFGLVLWIYNEQAIYAERIRREKRSRASPREIELQVRDWLFRRQFAVAYNPESKAAFSLNCQDQVGRKVFHFS